MIKTRTRSDTSQESPHSPVLDLFKHPCFNTVTLKSSPDFLAGQGPDPVPGFSSQLAPLKL